MNNPDLWPSLNWKDPKTLQEIVSLMLHKIDYLHTLLISTQRRGAWSEVWCSLNEQGALVKLNAPVVRQEPKAWEVPSDDKDDV